MTDSLISPLAFIGPGVELGKNVAIGPGAVLLGPCIIEDDVWIGPGAQIGAPPEMSDHEQNAAWAGTLAHAGVRICEGAVIREHAVIHQGSYRETTIGARSWILNRAYVAHDVLIGEDVTVSAGVSIGGHCVIGSRTNLGMNAVVHQRVIISAGCMIGMGTPVARDLPPHVKAYGSPARIKDVNVVGLERRGMPASEIELLRTSYTSGDLLLKLLDTAQLNSELATEVDQWKERADRRPAQTSFAPARNN